MQAHMQARSSSDKAGKPRPRSTKSKEKDKPAAPHEPTPARLLLRVHSAKQLHQGMFSQGIYCKMYVGETAMLHGSQKSLFSKMTGGDDKEDAAKAKAKAHHREFRTRTVAPPADAESVALWDETFDVLLTDASREILSVRVKSKHRLYPAVLGVCAIPLKQLRIGHSVDKWVPLLKGTREVASLKLQLVLSPVADPVKSAERLAKPDLQADIKTALAANQSADDAIDRLLASATFKLSNRGGTVIPADNDQEDADHHQNESSHAHDDNKNQNKTHASKSEMVMAKGVPKPTAAAATSSA